MPRSYASQSHWLDAICGQQEATAIYTGATCLVKLPNSPNSFHCNTVFGLLQFKVLDHHKRINCLHCLYQPMLMCLYLWHFWFLLVQGHHLIYLSVCLCLSLCVTVTWPVCHHSFGLYLYVCHSHMACVTSHVTVHLACICLPVSLLARHCLTTHLARICLSVSLSLGLCHYLCHHSSGLYVSACVIVTWPVSPLTHLACICLPASLSPSHCHSLCHHSSGLYVSACVTVTRTVSLPHHSSGMCLSVSLSPSLCHSLCHLLTWPS